MSPLYSETDHLLLYDPDKARSSCHIFISHPTPLEEKTLGKLFIICEIDSPDKINQEIISIIQEEVKNNYYYSNETNIETAFENALSKANEGLNHLISEGITEWLEKFNIIIAVLKDSQLYLTSIGRMHAFLIHQDKIIDIINQPSPDQEKINPLKIFSSVISGNLNPGDQILLCTSSILDYFSQEKLKRLISETIPQEAVSQLEKILLEAGQDTAFGAIVVKLVPKKEPETPEFSQKQVISSAASAPQASMEELIQKERRTSEYLTPSVMPNMVKSFGKYLRKGNDLVRTKILKKPPKRRRPDTYYTPIRRERAKWYKELSSQVLGDFKKFFVFSGSSLRYLGKITKGTFSRRKDIKSKLKELPTETEQKIHGGVFRFKRLNRKSKIVLIMAVAILFIFSTSIVFLGLGQDRKFSKERKEEMIQEIKDKTFEAGAALSYEDERGAKTLLSEARKLLEELPNRSKSDKEIVSRLEAGINEQYNKTKHIITITDPLLKKDLSEVSSQAGVSGILQFAEYIYLFNSNNEIYRLNLENGDVQVIENSLTDIGQYVTDVKESTNVFLLYHDKKGIIEYNTLSERLTPLTIDFTDEFQGLTDLAVYRSRFYYLDAKGNQIYRHQRGTFGFGPATSWIHDPNMNIQDGVSIVIDGSIYLLEKTGRVKELFQGRELDFSLDTIDPELKSATIIWTDENSNYLYILDPSGKRLVQFDKKGNLKNQYTSDKFEGLKGFAISEKDQKAWLLAGSKVFEITIEL